MKGAGIVDRVGSSVPAGERRFSITRAAIGPVERLLNMLGHQKICALAYALAFAMNVMLCIALVPRFGGHGAAAATSISLTFETVLLFWIVRRRLGLHVLAFGR